MNKEIQQIDKIIFLDVDGVLTSKRCNGFYDFDLWAVSFLRDACERSGAKIVMSSAWRTLAGAHNVFSQTFGEYLHQDWRTKDDARTLRTRGQEIDEWLSRHQETGNFVIIDDTIYGLKNHRKWLVLTSIEDGLLHSHMLEIHKKLQIYGGLPRLKKIFNNPVCFYTEREEEKSMEFGQWESEVRSRNARLTLENIEKNVENSLTN